MTSPLGSQAWPTKPDNKKPRHLTGGALMLRVNKGESGFEFN
jgi:hypothetical protein